MNHYNNVQSDMQWIRRCKQEEITLMEQLNEEDEIAQRQKLI